MKALLRMLWPFVSRRRFRQATQLAARLQLGNRELSERVAKLERAAGHAAPTLDEATGEIRRLTRLLALAEARFTEAEATVKDQGARIRDLGGRIECQADNHETDRTEWSQAKSRLAARVTELEQLLVRADADNAELSGRLQDAGLDAAWPDVAAVSGPQSKSFGR